MNENLCIAIITTASIFAGFLVAFLSSYLTARNKEYDENKLKFDTLGRKLTLFRQLCGFIWNSNCLNEQRGKLKANEPALDEDGNVKSFMHAIDALHRDLKLKQYKQNPYIDYSEEDLDRIKIFVNSIWYNLIHKNYQEVHFSQLLDCPMGISPGYFTTIRKELEVFWGGQAVKRIDKKNGFKLLTESGVTLFFYLLPDGHVTITLYPAQTEAIRPVEDCILLHRFIKATWLLKEKNQKSLWRDFMAYTECTSLIGTPSIWQRLRIFWLKYSCPLCIDGVQQSIRAHMHFQKIVTFVLTVGLSGFLLLAVQQCHKEKEKDYSPLIEQTNKGIEDVQKGQDEILKEIHSISANIDSLMKFVPISQKKPVVTNKNN